MPNHGNGDRGARWKNVGVARNVWELLREQAEVDGVSMGEVVARSLRVYRAVQRERESIEAACRRVALRGTG